MNLQEKANKALELGKVEGAKKLLSEMYQQEDKQVWNEAKRAEYETIFPTQRDMTDDEKTEYDKQFSDKNPKPVMYDEEGNEIPFVYPKIDIEYISIDKDGNEIRTPSNYQTFDEWLNETKVVSKATYYTYDEYKAGLLDGEEAIPEDKWVATIKTPEVNEPVRPYTPLTKEELETKVGTYLTNSEQYKLLLKKEKRAKLDSIKVEVNGNLFDGNETARLNMLSAVQAANVNGITKANWKLADNTIVEVTIDDINTALVKSIEAVGSIVI